MIRIMIELQKMDIVNIKQCGDIHLRAFRFETSDDYAEHSTELSDSLRKCYDFTHYFSRFIEDYDKYAFCIISDEQIVGYITALEIPSLVDDNAIYIDSIAVAPEFQKKGYGKEALTQFMNMFPETTTKKLQTTKDRPAYKMYKQLGFIDMELQVMETNSILAKLYNENQALKQELAELQSLMER